MFRQGRIGLKDVQDILACVALIPHIWTLKFGTAESDHPSRNVISRDVSRPTQSPIAADWNGHAMLNTHGNVHITTAITALIEKSLVRPYADFHSWRGYAFAILIAQIGIASSEAGWPQATKSL